MKGARIFVFAVALFGCAIADQSSSTGRQFDSAVPICVMIENPQRYDGQSALIDTLYRLEPHGPTLFGASCSKKEVRFLTADNYTENKIARATLDLSIKRDDTKPVEVVYRGKFRIVHGFSCTAVTCYLYELEASELVAARKTK